MVVDLVERGVSQKLLPGATGEICHHLRYKFTDGLHLDFAEGQEDPEKYQCGDSFRTALISNFNSNLYSILNFESACLILTIFYYFI